MPRIQIEAMPSVIEIAWVSLLLIAVRFCSSADRLYHISFPTANGLAVSSSKYTYRMAKTSDLPAIAELLNDVFENNDYTANNEKNTENFNPKSIEEKLKQRMVEMKSSSFPHAFLVATPTSPSENLSSSVVAFLELGTMPSPIAMEKEWNGVKVTTRPELPFVANVVVNKSTRRQNIGKTLVQLALKIAQKWCDAPSFRNQSEISKSSGSSTSCDPFLFLSVDAHNVGALSFYESLNFEEIQLTTESSLPAAKVYLKKDLFP